MVKRVVRSPVFGPVFRWACAGLAAVVVMAAALWAFAPQVIVLAKEGFPAATWPAPGGFTPVPGAVDPAPYPNKVEPLPDPALTRLSDSQGAVLISQRSGAPLKAGFLNGATVETRFNSYSLVKSLVGVLILRAVADGKISGLEVTVHDILGGDAPSVALGDALSMTSGLALFGEPPKEDLAKALDDNQFSPFSPVARLHAFGIENLFEQIVVQPDLQGQFHYQSANTALLGLVLEQAYNAPLPQILSSLIWQPAGAAQAYWRQNPTTGRASAYCCLYARPYDWLLVGRYLLENGTPDAPFLPPDLWQAWILPDLAPELRVKGSYGWQIRHDVLDRKGEALSGPFAYMMGHGGQMVYLLPQEKMVVVRFGGAPQLLHSTLYELE